MALEVAIFEHREIPGTAGGAANAGVPEPVDLNTIRTNTITGASLTSKLVTLPAGDYMVTINRAANGYQSYRTWLQEESDAWREYGVSDGNDLYTQSDLNIGNNGNSSVIALSFAEETTFGLYEQLQSSLNDTDKGRPSNIGPSEIYAQLVILKG